MKTRQHFKENNPIFFASLLVLIGSILFSTKAVLVKLAYQYEIDSLSLLTLRMAFALPLFFIALLFFRKKDKEKYSTAIKKKDWLIISVLGMLGFYAASLLDFLGLQYVSAGMERLILFTYPTTVLILNALFFKVKISKIQVLALSLAYFGIAIAFFQGATISGHPHFIFGGFLVFCCAFCYASFLVGSGQMLPRIGTLRFTTFAMTAAGIAVFIQHGIILQWELFHFAPPVYYLALLMAIFATVLPSFMISEGIRIIGSNNAAIIGSVGPISTIILAYIFLGETLGYIQWIGTAFVIGGVLLITSRRKKE